MDQEKTQEINGLRTYPDELGLPSDPFEGRVKAALKRSIGPGAGMKTDLRGD